MIKPRFKGYVESVEQKNTQVCKRKRAPDPESVKMTTESLEY